MPINPPPASAPLPGNKSSLTGAELRTLREACGLTVVDMAALAKVQDRTVKFWESGKAGVPDDVAALVWGLDAQFTAAAAEAMAVPRPPGWQSSDEMVLLRYASTEDLHRYQPDMQPLTHTAHGALLARVRAGLMAIGVTVRVVYMQPDAYAAWLQNKGAQDCTTLRTIWAAGQVEAQCLERPGKAA